VNGDLVLDTSVVIAALRGMPGIEARLDQVERLWLPLIALGELEIGVELASNSGAQRAALDAFSLAAKARRQMVDRKGMPREQAAELFDLTCLNSTARRHRESEDRSCSTVPA